MNQNTNPTTKYLLKIGDIERIKKNAKKHNQVKVYTYLKTDLIYEATPSKKTYPNAHYKFHQNRFRRLEEIDHPLQYAILGFP